MESDIAVVVKQEPNIDTCCTKIKERPQLKAESDDLETKLVISSCEMCCTPITPRVADPKQCPKIKVKTEPLSPYTNCPNLNIKKEHVTPLKVKRSLSIDSLNNNTPHHKRRILYSQKFVKRSNSRSSPFNERLKCSPSPTPSQGSFQSQVSFKRTSSPWPKRNWFNPYRSFDRHLHRQHRPFTHHPFRHHHHYNNIYKRPNSRQFYDIPKPKLEKDLFILRISSPMSCEDSMLRTPRPDKNILSNSNRPSEDVNKENQSNPKENSSNLNLIEVPITVHNPPSNLTDIEEDSRSSTGSVHEDDLRVVDTWDLNEDSNESSSDVAISSSNSEQDHDVNTEDNSNQISCNNNLPDQQNEELVRNPETEKSKHDDDITERDGQDNVQHSMNGAIKSSQIEETVESSQTEETVESSQTEETVESSQTEETVESSQTEEPLNSSQTGEAVVSSQAEDTTTVSLTDEIEVVKQVDKDSEVECLLNKCKEVHICTECFAERRRIKRNKEVIFVKKIGSKGDRNKIPIINLEVD